MIILKEDDINHSGNKLKVRLNEAIKAPTVRLILPTGEQLEDISNKEALEKAKEFGLDLVEVAPNANPPVVKIMDYGKHLYKKNKKVKVKKVQLKQIYFRPGTEEQDYQVKVNKITKLLGQKCKIKIIVRFRGREMAHQQLGNHLLERISTDLVDYAVVEQRPKFEGRQVMMVLAPHKAHKIKEGNEL